MQVNGHDVEFRFPRRGGLDVEKIGQNLLRLKEQHVMLSLISAITSHTSGKSRSAWDLNRKVSRVATDPRCLRVPTGQ